MRPVLTIITAAASPRWRLPAAAVPACPNSKAEGDLDWNGSGIRTPTREPMARRLHTIVTWKLTQIEPSVAGT